MPIEQDIRVLPNCNFYRSFGINEASGHESDNVVNPLSLSPAFCVLMNWYQNGQKPFTFSSIVNCF